MTNLAFTNWGTTLYGMNWLWQAIRSLVGGDRMGVVDPHVFVAFTKDTESHGGRATNMRHQNPMVYQCIVGFFGAIPRFQRRLSNDDTCTYAEANPSVQTATGRLWLLRSTESARLCS